MSLEPRLLSREEAAAHVKLPLAAFAKIQDVKPIKIWRYKRWDRRALDEKLTWTTIYFIGGQSTGLIKIGSSFDAATRIKTLQTGSPDVLRVIGSMRAVVGAEAALHRRFRRLRAHGEWFSPGAALLAYIAENAL